MWYRADEFRITRLGAGPYARPAYAKPDAYKESEVTVGTDHWALPGTRTMPAASGPVPAVVLVPGSGPGDRDATVGQIKQFKDLALGLASRGIAVLRYDKRTQVHANRMRDLAGLTVNEETIDDAIAAVQLLRSTPGVDPNRIVVLGHSLGGMLVPRIAAAEPPVAGFVVMAGAARPIVALSAAEARNARSEPVLSLLLPDAANLPADVELNKCAATVGRDRLFQRKPLAICFEACRSAEDMPSAGDLYSREAQRACSSGHAHPLRDRNEPHVGE